MRILITGGTGFIGRNLVEHLGSLHKDVFAPSSAELNLCSEWAVHDYLATHLFDVVVHTATTRSNRRLPSPPDLVERNCRMVFNLVRNRQLFGKMIHFGSGAEYNRVQLPPRVSEDYFDTRIPGDSYGFSKYVCAKHIEGFDRILNLRLFGVFGPYEDYTARFISYACCRALQGLPIVLLQDAKFDYLYVKDLVAIVAWFIGNDVSGKAYNVASGRSLALAEIARMIIEVSGSDAGVSILNGGMGVEYSADNSRMLAAMGDHRFWELRDSVRDLYEWYQHGEKSGENGLKMGLKWAIDNHSPY